MASSKAATVAEYLGELPEARRAELEPVLTMVRRSMPAGYAEGMAWGMITWSIPLSRYPDTYNDQPLGYVALAAQKSYNSLYLMSVYSDSSEERELRTAFDRAGLKLDMGKSCVRFRRAADLPLAAIGKIIARTTPEAMIATYEAVRRGAR